MNLCLIPCDLYYQQILHLLLLKITTDMYVDKRDFIIEKQIALHFV